MLDLLGHAGCVSIEAGVESISPEGRALLINSANYRPMNLPSACLCEKSIPFVQANLLAAKLTICGP